MADENVTERMARLGYAARGTVYLIVGAFAVLAALGPGGRTTDQKGALQAVLGQPFGKILLGIMALGLFSFAIWRALQAVPDVDRCGHGAKALVRRTAFAVSAVAHAGLAVWAVGALIGSGRGGGDADQSAHDWTAALLAAPFGQWLVAAAGIIVAATGIAVGVRGWKGTFAERLVLTEQNRRWVIPMGRFGFLARAVVFLLIGAFLIMAAAHTSAQEAKGLAGALKVLQDQPHGWFLLGLTALGLFAFGAFQFVTAVYRRIDAPGLHKAAAEVQRSAQAAGQHVSEALRERHRP
jgi:hypothetical protein